MASSAMAPSSMAGAAFAGGSDLPAGSALYAAEPSNAVAALIATSQANAAQQGPVAQAPFAQAPTAQARVGTPFTATPSMGGANMAAPTGGQPFWLNLMAENADKAKSQNLIGTSSPKAARVAKTGTAPVAAQTQQGKTLEQYRAAARLITSPGPATRIYR